MKKQLFTFTWLSSFCFFHLLLTAWGLWWITSNSALPKINPKKIRTRSTDPNGTYTEEWVAITENFEKLALTTPSDMRNLFSNWSKMGFLVIYSTFYLTFWWYIFIFSSSRCKCFCKRIKWWPWKRLIKGLSSGKWDYGDILYDQTKNSSFHEELGSVQYKA